MKKQRVPKGWDEQRVRELAAFYDQQTEAEQAAEIETAVELDGQTLVVVPTELLPEVLQLIAKKHSV